MTTKPKFELTPEEKERWRPMFLRTWDAVAYDAIECCGGRCSAAEAIEFATDANRPEMFAGMTREEYRAFCQMDRKTVDKWLRTFFRGSYVA